VRWEKHVARARVRGKKDRNNFPAFPDGDWKGTGYLSAGKPFHGCRAFVFGDVSKVRGRQLMDAVGVEKVDVIFGGPPCQGLSTSNSRACLEDQRNGMIWEYMRLVDEIRPGSFIIENVPAILTIAKGALFNAIARLANDAGYNVVAQKLDACSYGVPQHRVRAIIVGTNVDAETYRYPMPTHWAIGRPVSDKGWDIGAEDEGDGVRENRPPAAAHFDPSTRRWVFDGASVDSVPVLDIPAQAEMFT
jgi:site-specific DNA-cytosine methylase